MSKLKPMFAAAMLAMATIPCSQAAIILNATINNASENPPTVPTTAGGQPRPASFGTATFIMNDAMTSMTFTATIFNIDVTGTQTTDTNDNLIAAHIHAGPAVTPTTNGGVVWGFFGAPFNDNNPNDFLLTPTVGGVGGTFSGKWDAPEGNNTTLAAQVANILAGRSYINFHTTQFTGGEIRGNIVLTSTPEPSTMALFGSGIVGLIALGRRFRSRRS